MNAPSPPLPDMPNLLANPLEIGTPPWLILHSTVTPGYAAPDGSATAVLVAENNTFDQHGVQQAFGPVTGGAVYSLSCHLKAGSRHRVRMVLWDHGLAGSGANVWFDLASGKIGTAGVFGASAAHLDYRMEAVGNGWYRCELSCRVSTVASAGVYTAQIQLAAQDGGVGHQGDGVAGILLWSPYVGRVASVATAVRTQANLLSCSNLVGTAPWEPAGVSVGKGYASPDGAETAAFLRESDENGEHDVRQMAADVLPGRPYTFSCFCRASSRQWVRLVLWDHGASNSGANAWFDLTRGTLGTSGLFGEGASGLVCWMENVGNGWYRCVVSCVVSDALAVRGYLAQIQIAPADNISSYQGDGESGVLVWGAQLEQRRTARPLLPTGDLITGDPEIVPDRIGPGAHWLRAMPTPLTDVLTYGHNRGGLNNQKLALLGMFLMARRLGPRRIILPEFYAPDPNRLAGRALPFDVVFDAARVREYAARYDIEILPDTPPEHEGGWEYFNMASTYISHNTSVDNLGVDDFCCDFLRAMEPRLTASGLAKRLYDSVFVERNVQVVLQLRVEMDWVRYVSTALMPSFSPMEECELSFATIIRKVREGLPASESGIFVACDEAYLPFGKAVIRDVIRKDLGIELIFKSDLLGTDERRELSRLELSLLDFEMAVAAPFYVGQSRSTFSNLVGLERYARRRSPVTNHYIYNIKGRGLGQRTDNGAYAVPESVIAPGKSVL